jgi:hypothetical protein
MARDRRSLEAKFAGAPHPDAVKSRSRNPGPRVRAPVGTRRNLHPASRVRYRSALPGRSKFQINSGDDAHGISSCWISFLLISALASG